MTTQVKTVIRSLDEVNLALQNLSAKKSERDKLIADLAKKKKDLMHEMTGIDNQIEDQTMDIDTEITQLEQNIIIYALNNLNEFRTGKSKSKKFTYGEVKTQEKDDFKWPSDEELVFILKDVMGEKKAAAFIQVKEIPSKAVLKAFLKRDGNEGVADKLGIDIEKETKIKIVTH